jgi:Flp pilus assembly protein TadG
MTRRIPPRSGATAVEVAATLPVLLIFTIGLTIGSMGIFRYQEVALLAREGSRWASVHGSTYQSEAGRSTAVTASDVYTNAMQPLVTALDNSKLTYSLTYYPDATSPSSTVKVTVNYQWFPEGYLIGPINLSCSSMRMMAY